MTDFKTKLRGVQFLPDGLLDRLKIEVILEVSENYTICRSIE